MRIAIMQPYFMPYIGYFQLINSVDRFVIYDNIQYTKKGWINRNRFLQGGKDSYFTIPLKNDSDYLNVNQRYISKDFNRKKLLNQIYIAYRKAPYFERSYNFFEKIVTYDENNLFTYIYNSIRATLNEIDLNSNIIFSSDINIDHTLKGQQKVIEICKELNADTYINAIGGIGIYSKEEFDRNYIDLQFIKTGNIIYKQFDDEFIPWLSIIDVLMFNKSEDIGEMLNNYKLIRS